MSDRQISPQEAENRYKKIFFPTMIIYAVSCFIAPEVISRSSLAAPANYLIALVPAVAVWVAIWSQARLLRETDEYQRSLLADASLIALAFTMALATGWGFLEVNAGAPKFPLLMILPAFYLFFGFIRLFLWLRNKEA
ncbi:MAG: hypothetical protein P1U58_10750 [Verrucomicrobiales bacterium]|nr:hypothetical protein [Verrucomicrobiales bacterium]